MNEENINRQKSDLLKWKKDFFDNLSKKQNTDIDLFLAEENWFIKYINSKNNYQEIKSDSSFDKTELKIKFENEKMEELPKIIILNRTCYASLSDDLKKKFVNRNGSFNNKILLIDLKISKSNIYCIFFKDIKGNVRQGYLQINKSGDDEIINKFKEEEPLNLFKEYNIEINDYSIYKDKDKFIIKIFNINNNFFKLDVNNENSINAKTNIYHKPEILKKDNNGLDTISESDETKSKTQISKKTKKINMIYKNEIPVINIYSKKEKADVKKSIINTFKNENSNNFKPKKTIIKRLTSSKKEISRNKGLGLKLMDFLPNKSFHKEMFLTPGLVGLENARGFIYLNAVLQSLSNIGRLRIYLLTKNIYEDLKNNMRTDKKLSFALAEVLFNIWEKPDRRFFPPNNIKNLIYSYNPVFIKEPKDLILFILDNIHQELNNLQNKDNSLSNIKFETNNNFLNALYNNYINDFFNKNSSIIVDEFYGFIAKEFICQKCSNITFKFEEIKIISLSLEEIGKFINKKDINISDCFSFYTKKENNTRETCQNCNSFQSKEIKIMNAPKTLILNFDRKDNIGGNIRIFPEEYLDIKKYIFNSKSNYYYELKGMICEEEKGNFIAYCKNSDNCE